MKYFENFFEKPVSPPPCNCPAVLSPGGKNVKQFKHQKTRKGRMTAAASAWGDSGGRTAFSGGGHGLHSVRGT